MAETKNNTLLDKRCRKTRKAIKTSLIKRMSIKDISEITITEISEDAEINRKTFYSHYNDLYAILDEIENDQIEKLQEIIDRVDIMKSIYNPYQLFNELTNELNNDLEFYKLLVKSRNCCNVLTKLQKAFKERFIEVLEIETKTDPDTLSYILDFQTAGIISVYKEWFDSGNRIPLEQLSKILSSLIENGMNSLLERK